MGIRLVYGLKTRDLRYLDSFYPSRRLAEAAAALCVDYGATIFDPELGFERVLEFCGGHVALLRGELPIGLYRYLEASGCRTVNRAEATALAGDKLASAERFASIGAAHPGTAPIRPDANGPPLPFPFVAKPRYGKMGRGVELVDTKEAWEALAAGPAAETDYLAQAYVEPSRGRDLRFFYARFDPARRESLPIAVKRTGQGLASNAHAGGSMERYAAPPGLRAEADRIFADSGLDYGTVDFLFGDERDASFYVCEMNACPGFEALEALGSVDAAEAILGSALTAGGQS